MDDTYELKCQPTDDDLNEIKNQVLLPEKKNISKTTINYSFNDFIQSYLFQILLVLILVYFIYYGMNYVFSNIGKIPSFQMKGGRKYSK